MSSDEFGGIYFDDARSQARYDELVAAVATAELERGPLALSGRPTIDGPH